MESEVKKIDLDAVLRSRLPRHYRFIPSFLVKGLERLIRQDELNRLLRLYGDRRGGEFCRAVLDDLNVTYTVEGTPPADGSSVIFASNHPLGALDGIILIDWASRLYGPDVKFVVNDLLMAIEPLRDVFLPINKHGRQSRHSSELIDEGMHSPATMIVFPAGLVSRRLKEGIADLRWQKMFVNKALESGRKIVPVKFEGENSSFFYNFAKLRERSGVKFNIEMALLPREIFRCRGRRFIIRLGNPIDSGELKGGAEALREAQRIREIVYSL